MSQPADPEDQPKRRGVGGKLLLPVALLTAVGGFALGLYGRPLVAPEAPEAAEPEVVDLEAGTFVLAMPGLELQFVEASVSIRPDAAPDGPGPLHDAVYVLLTDASGFPLVLDGRSSLPELEKVVMSMAPAAAPWLVALDLKPSDGRPRAPGPEATEEHS